MASTVPARPKGARHRDLSRLAAILSRSAGSVIVALHTKRVKTGNTKLPWYAKQSTQESLDAAVFLVSGPCSRENILELIKLRWITLKQLKLFLKHTPLNDNVRAVIEYAIRTEEERLDALERERNEKVRAATEFSSGLDITGQLQRILDGETAGDPAPIPVSERERFRRMRVSAHA